MPTTTEELVSTFSHDGYRLDGVAFQPAAERSPATDVVVCVPGLYATFYDAPYILLGRALAGLGLACLVGNDRGHDFGAVLRTQEGRPVCGGGGWERLEESL